MKNKYFLILAMTFLSSGLFAQTSTVWNPAANAASTGLWSEAANWTEGNVPEGNYKVVFNVPDLRACILNDVHTIKQLVMGDGGDGDTLRIANGATLTTGAVWSAVGYNAKATMIVDTGGTVNFGEHMWIGLAAGSDGILVLNGGTINVTAMTGIGWDGGKGTVYIKSGLLNLGNLDPAGSIKTGSLLDISGGKITIKGDKTTAVNDYVTAGKITITGGSGELSVKYDLGTDLTTVYVLPTRQATTVWNPAPESSSSWFVDANWSDGRIPLDNKVVFNVPGVKECVLDGVANIGQFVLGDGDEGGTLRIAAGGTLTTGIVWSGIAWTHPATLIVEAGGTVTFGEHMWVGWEGDATVEISGVINVAQMYGTAFEGNAGTGETYVKKGGVLNLTGFHPTKSIPEGSLLDITGGTVTIKGDQTAVVQTYADLGVLTAEGGAEDIVLTYNSTSDLTIIKSSTTVGVNKQISRSSFGIYPNPASDFIYVKNNAIADVNIYSAIGQLVLTKQNASVVNVQSLKPGCYFVKVNLNGNIQVDKLIIK